MSDGHTQTPDHNGPKHQTKADAGAGHPHAEIERPIWKQRRAYIPAVFILLVIIIVATSVGRNGDGSGGEAGTAADDDLQFTVNDFECGLDSISSDFGDATPSGQFCILHVKVENLDTSAQAVSARHQVLIDDQDREFAADNGVHVKMALDMPIFEEIDPGEAIDVQMAFDVPEDAEIRYARLHDSAFSDGALIDLG